MKEEYVQRLRLGKNQCFYGAVGSQGDQGRVEGEGVGGKELRMGARL